LSLLLLFDGLLEDLPFGQWKILQDLVNVSVIQGKQFPESAGSFEELKYNTTDISLFNPVVKEPGLHLRPAGSSNILAPFLFMAQRKIARTVRDGSGEGWGWESERV